MDELPRRCIYTISYTPSIAPSSKENREERGDSSTLQSVANPRPNNDVPSSITRRPMNSTNNEDNVVKVSLLYPGRSTPEEFTIPCYRNPQARTTGGSSSQIPQEQAAVDPSFLYHQSVRPTNSAFASPHPLKIPPLATNDPPNDPSSSEYHTSVPPTNSAFVSPHHLRSPPVATNDPSDDAYHPSVPPNNSAFVSPRHLKRPSVATNNQPYSYYNSPEHFQYTNSFPPGYHPSDHYRYAHPNYYYYHHQQYLGSHRDPTKPPEQTHPTVAQTEISDHRESPTPEELPRKN